MRYFGYGDPSMPQPNDPVGAFRELAGTINAQRQALGHTATMTKNGATDAYDEQQAATAIRSSGSMASDHPNTSASMSLLDDRAERGRGCAPIAVAR